MMIFLIFYQRTFMKILLIGASGTIGFSIKSLLEKDNDIITAGVKQGDVQVDLSNEQSIKNMFEKIGHVDAVISAAGLSVVFKPLAEMTAQDYLQSFQSKALGQIQLALIAKDYLNDGGSITLTSGILTDSYIKAGSAASMVNGAIDTFVKAAACEMPKHIRINVISPTLLEESKDIYDSFFPGFKTVTAAEVATAFKRSVYGVETGKIYKVQ